MLQPDVNGNQHEPSTRVSQIVVAYMRELLRQHDEGAISVPEVATRMADTFNPDMTGQNVAEQVIAELTAYLAWEKAQQEAPRRG
jgi:hypothetical protein